MPRSERLLVFYVTVILIAVFVKVFIFDGPPSERRSTITGYLRFLEIFNKSACIDFSFLLSTVSLSTGLPGTLWPRKVTQGASI